MSAQSASAELALGHLAQLHANAAQLHVHLHRSWSVARYPAGPTRPATHLANQLALAADTAAKLQAQLQDAMSEVRKADSR